MNILHKFKGKTRQEKLDYLNSLQYETQIRHQDGIFRLIMPQLLFVAVHEDLGEAYKDLFEQKQRFFNKIVECDSCDLEDEIVLPQKIQDRQKTCHQLKVFTYKLLIFFVVVVILLFSGFGAILKEVPIQLNLATPDNSVEIARFIKTVRESMSEELQSFSNVPESQKQQRLEKFRKLFQDLKPVFNELRETLSVAADESKVDEEGNSR